MNLNYLPLMHFAGFAPVSTIDYPGEIAAVIYTQGCNLRCPYCHNKGIVEGKGDDLTWDEVRDRLQQHADVITGVVITGGEPTLFIQALQELVQYLHDEMQLKVKLDTNGATIFSIGMVAKHLDYLAMDFKCPKMAWNEFSDGYGYPYDNLHSLWLTMKNNNVPWEMRTTVHKALLPLSYLGEMALLRSDHICNDVPWYLQRFKPCDCFDNSLNDKPNYTPEELAFIARELGAYTRGCGEYDVLPEKKQEKDR